MSALRRFLLGVLGVVVLVCSISWWLLSTESGTRFLFARAGGFLPDALSIGEVSGTVRTRLLGRDIRWQDTGTDASIQSVEVAVDLWRLMDEEIALKDLTVNGVVVRIAPQPATDEPAAPLDISLPIGIRLTDAALHDIQLEVGGTRRQFDSIHVAALMEDADLNVDALAVDSSWLKLNGNGRVRLSGTLPTTATIDWEYLELADWPLAGRLEIGGDLESLAVEHSLQQPVEVQTTGELSFQDESILAELENRWENIVFDAFGVDSSRGLLTVRGTPDQFSLSVSALASVRGVPETRIEAGAQMTPSSASSIELAADNAWGQTIVHGNAEWGAATRFQFAYALDEINVQQFAPQLSGVLAAAGQVSGTIAESSRSVSLAVEAVDGRLNGYPVTGSGTFNIEDQALAINGLSASVGTNRITASGRVGERIDLMGSLRADTLSAFHPDLRGTADANITLQGAADNPTIDLQVVTSEFAWQDQQFDTLRVTAAGAADQHRIDIGTRAFATDLSLEANGRLQEQGWVGAISRLSVEHPSAGQWRLGEPAAVAVSGASASLQDFCLSRTDGAGVLCANLSAANTSEFEVSIEALPVTALPLGLPPSIRAEGEIFATLSGELIAERLSADAAVEVRDAAVVSSFEDETLVTRFSDMRLDADIARNRLDAVASIETQEGNLQVQAIVDDVFQPSSAVSGTAALNIPDIAQLNGLLPALASPQGSADGELRFSGSLSTPEITGALQLRDGAFGVRAAGIRVTEIDAQVSQDKPGSLALAASANSGGGKLELLGNTTISDAKQLTTTLALIGADFELAKTPDWQVLASPNVTVVVTEASTLVSGDLTVPKASVKLREIPPSAARASPDAIVHRSGDEEGLASLRPINVDLKTILGDQVSLSAFGLNTNLQGNLQLRGDANKLINGFGRVSLVEGRYKAYGQELSIQRGELIFNGPLARPQLDVRAVRDAGEVVAGIQVRGTPDALQSELFSQPPLRDIEALSYLLTGRPINQENAEGDLLGDAAFALGLTGAGAIASRVRSNLGLDTLSIQGGTEDGRIVAGKRLNDRLLVEYGYGLVDRLGTLLLRYQLNDRLVLESRTGVVSNLDLVYRVRKQ